MKKKLTDVADAKIVDCNNISAVESAVKSETLGLHEATATNDMGQVPVTDSGNTASDDNAASGMGAAVERGVVVPPALLRELVRGFNEAHPGKLVGMTAGCRTRTLGIINSVVKGGIDI